MEQLIKRTLTLRDTNCLCFLIKLKLFQKSLVGIGTCSIYKYFEQTYFYIYIFVKDAILKRDFYSRLKISGLVKNGANLY